MFSRFNAVSTLAVAGIDAGIGVAATARQRRNLAAAFSGISLTRN